MQTRSMGRKSRQRAQMELFLSIPIDTREKNLAPRRRATKLDILNQDTSAELASAVHCALISDAR
jgi:hypothetical protein